MLLSEAIEALAIATRADGATVQTVASYRRKLKQLVQFLGDIDVSMVTTSELQRYVVSLRDRSTRWADHPVHEARKGGLSKHTIASYVKALKRLFAFLHDEGIVSTNPAARIKTPRPKQGKPKGIDYQDFLALVTTCEGTLTDVRDRAILYFLCDTGCRVAGLVGLMFDDIDFADGLATLHEKGDETRQVPFTARTAEALQRWLAIRPEVDHESIFVSFANRNYGEPLSTSAVRHLLKRRARRAGVEGRVNPHSFRHALARHYLLSGGDLGTLSALLGHSNVQITVEYYSVFLAHELREKHRRHSPITALLGGDDNGHDC